MTHLGQNFGNSNAGLEPLESASQVLTISPFSHHFLKNIAK
jgi:hypothetical protein